ncbi:hypothetical protein [Rhodococcus sp. H29-C3]|uniref:hypothetical protein n=1 Tax=Rhodococcus sp. H29-C3 TaxID=3046307 RepID=UPI0024BA5C5E|nr:hypothetical protein [Rhodococcus sp. H29-C3]MDJ0363035.1 hypothetical protein [Rhodococcus sp. H29-C3]
MTRTISRPVIGGYFAVSLLACLGFGLLGVVAVGATVLVSLMVLAVAVRVEAPGAAAICTRVLELAQWQPNQAAVAKATQMSAGDER